MNDRSSPSPRGHEAARAAARHVLYNAGLQLLMLAGHVAAAAWVGAISLGVIQAEASLDGIAGVLLRVFVIAGLLWTPVNAVGLYRRRPWARASTIAYWAAGIPICCCIPLGLYGVWSLTRPSVRSLLDGE